MRNPLRYHQSALSHTAFGEDSFGQFAERLARFFGTATYIISQTIFVIIWILANGYFALVHFDPFPFILLNLMFSTQAAYAAPLILLAATRQADRDRLHAEATAQHTQNESDIMHGLLATNTSLTREIHELTKEIHDKVNS
jgi:uncharacterized membrane protein